MFLLAGCTGGPEDPTPKSPTIPSPTADSFVPSIVFASDRSGDVDIWIVGADGADLQNLTHNPASDTSPAWSPDGRRIAFVSDRSGARHIYVMNADGSNSQALTTGDSSEESEPAWSPDGERLAFVARDTGPDPSDREVLDVMSIDGSDSTGIADDTSIEGPAWSPDGTRIVFSNSAANLELVDLAGGFHEITEGKGEAGDPAWCPRGAPIAFGRLGLVNGNLRRDIWFVSPEGGSPQRLTDDGRSDQAAWSPGGDRLAFVRHARSPSYSGDVYLMNAHGGDLTQLTSGPADDWAPAWQPPSA